MFQPIWGAKLLTVFLLFVVAGHLIAIRRVGRQLAALAGQSDSPEYKSLIDSKYSKWMCLSCNLGIIIFIIEVMVQVRLSNKEYPPLFWLHLPAAALFALLVFGVLPLVTGKVSPGFHRIAGNTALGLFLLAFLTGAVLLWQL